MQPPGCRTVLHPFSGSVTAAVSQSPGEGLPPGTWDVRPRSGLWYPLPKPNICPLGWRKPSISVSKLSDGSQIAQDTSSLLANEPCSRFMSWPLKEIPSSPEVYSSCDSTWELTCWSFCMQAKELHFSANRLLGQGLWKPKVVTEPGRFFMDHSGWPITHCGSLSWSISLVCLRNAQILRALAVDSHSLSACASTAEAEKV